MAEETLRERVFGILVASYRFNRTDSTLKEEWHRMLNRLSNGEIEKGLSYLRNEYTEPFLPTPTQFYRWCRPKGGPMLGTRADASKWVFGRDSEGNEFAWHPDMTVEGDKPPPLPSPLLAGKPKLEPLGREEAMKRVKGLLGKP